MCGIVYTRRTDGKPARKSVLKQYRRQEDRGNEGFGYVAIDDTRTITDYKRTQTEEGARKALATTSAPHILFHHRFPTSTINVPESAHPIVIQHAELKYTYYVTHNGVIQNPAELHAEHIANGYKYSTEVKSLYQTANGVMYHGEANYNDSEALAIEIARTIEGLQSTVRATGTIAYIVLQTLAGKVIATYYGTNGGNPLTMRAGKTGITIASEGGSPIVDNIAYRLDAETSEITIASVPLSYAQPMGYGFNRPYDLAGEWEDELADYEAEDIAERIAEIDINIKLASECEELEELDELVAERNSLTAELIDRRATKRFAF